MADLNLGESIHATLSERILRWDYLPGHRFTEEELCAEFGVSRSPIREALRVLVENGLVEKQPRVGYRVRLLDFREIDELYDVRLALEEFVVRRLCRDGVASARLEELHRHWAEIHAQLPISAPLVPAEDESFHESLAKLTRNSTLCKALKDMDRRIHFVRLADFSNPERVEVTCVEHLELLEALGARDLDRSLDVLRRNIEGGRSSVERAIKEALAHAYRNRD